MINGKCMDRMYEVLRAAERLRLTKRQAEVMVGGRRRLEKLVSEGKIEAVKKGERQTARWECNGADVIRYAKRVVSDKC